MTALRNHSINFPILNGLAALIITGLLLILCAQLVKFTPLLPAVKNRPYTINFVPPPAAPEIIEQEAITLRPIDPADVAPPDSTRFDTLPDLNSGTYTSGAIPVTVIKPDTLVREPARVIDIYTPEHVDRMPRVLSPVIPAYPFDAQRKGVEGRVVLRFVVDENGQVQNPEVIKAEPAGVFEQAALAAILKYRFVPAVVNNKKVKCFAVLPIGFRLN